MQLQGRQIMKAKEIAKVKTCSLCRLQGSTYCNECYDFGLFAPKDTQLDLYTTEVVVEGIEA
jgi:hypothetical protein